MSTLSLSRGTEKAGYYNHNDHETENGAWATNSI